MRKHKFPFLLTGLLIPLVLAGVLFVGTAAPFGLAQDDNRFPTPTYVPIPDDFSYTVETVRYTDEVVTFADQTIDGFSFTDFTYVTQYPRGLEFSVQIDMPEDIDVASVNLIYRFPAGAQGRAQATYLEEEDRWVAVPYDRGGLAPWMTMDVFWRVAFGAEGVAQTEPINVQYTDPTREWFRMESDDVIAYWFDFSEELGTVVAEAFVAVRARYLEAFGEFLPFKPTVVIFPPGELLGEFRVGGQINPRTTGFAVSDSFAAVLRIRGLEIEELRQDCIWNEPRDEEWQMRFAASVATHEVGHLYQFEFGGGAAGPTWWVEGQATYLELEMGPVEERLRALVAAGEDLFTLQGTGPPGMVSMAASDGCTHLGYEMGAHFINYIVNRFGPEAHATIVDNILLMSLDEAIELATGVPLSQLERDWRAYLGANPEPNIIPTQPMMFPPTPTPFGQ